MSEPKRLVEDDGVMRSLLESMREDHLDADARQRLQAAFGIGIGTTAITSAAAQAASGGAKVSAGATAKAATVALGSKSLVGVGIAKWLGLIALGGAAVGVVAARPPKPIAITTARPVVEAPSAVPRAHESLPIMDEAPTTTEREAPVVVAPKRQSLVKTAKETPAPHATELVSDVTEELRLLEAARHKLRTQDAKGALATLERYRQSSPRRALDVEADVLEIEAFVAIGNRTLAKTKSEVFLHHHGEAPLAARVRRLMAGSTD